MSSSRKKARVAAAPESQASPSPSPSPAPSSAAYTYLYALPRVTATPLPDLAKPSALYLAELKTLAEFKRLTQEELTMIGESVSRASKRAAPMPKHNLLETPNKKALSAQSELARMDYMEHASVSALLHKHAHFGADEADEKASLEQTDEWREVEHVLALYEELRTNLVVRTPRRSKRAMAFRLLLVLLYTMVTVPLFTLAVIFAPVDRFILAPLFGVKNHFYIVDWVQKLYARGFLFLCGVEVVWHGMEHIPIERENREKAIQSLNNAAKVVKDHKRCIAVSPEGTRSRTGRIADFKKGAFHTALQVGVPVMPLLLEGAYDLWPSGALFVTPGVVHITVLPLLHPASASKETYNSLASKVRRRFLECNLRSAREAIKQQQAGGSSMGSPRGAGASRKGVFQPNFTLWSLWTPICYAVLYVVYRVLSAGVKAVL